MRRAFPQPLLCAVLAVLGALCFTGCETVTETGRSQLNLVSADEEMKLGVSAFQETKQKTPISRDAQASAMVQRAGQRIAAVATLPNAQWEFVLFDSPEANAWCLPGGKVGVYSGILPITKDEAGLATVIGHEVAHATAHHGAERMSQQMVAQFGSSAAGALTSGKSQATQALVGQAYGVVSQVGVLLPFSRKQEAEADYIGLLYMARAGYDPAAAVAFWQRFSDYNRQHGGGQGLSFLRTHPLDEQRIKDLQAQLPKAQAEYQKAKAAGK
ncbi:MAG TPA: M48 family metallopeptidase [Candidatus Paceibacterota bacterium]|nr:M48 family metallopeptidase [Verrucomicrobiota bacterium]HSA11748.1 M48 family metallopeptidase [Candidatus Paceibacterota bacterium]